MRRAEVETHQALIGCVHTKQERIIPTYDSLVGLRYPTYLLQWKYKYEKQRDCQTNVCEKTDQHTKIGELTATYKKIQAKNGNVG